MKRLSTADAGFAAEFRALLGEARETTERVDGVVAAIIAAVRDRGDAALCDYTLQFDHLALIPATLRVTADEMAAATAGIPEKLAAALDLAAQRIETFHRAQMPADLVQQDAAGSYVWVVGADGHAARRGLTLGAAVVDAPAPGGTAEASWVVQAGLAAGERVVTAGALKVEDGHAVEVGAP